MVCFKGAVCFKSPLPANVTLCVVSMTCRLGEKPSRHGSLFSLSPRQETGLSLLIVSICVASR